jgi:predicted component of type VI protein secretion system
MMEFKIITTPDRSQQASYTHAGRELRLGRAEGDLLIDDPQIAPLQVRVYHDGGAFVVENLGGGEVKVNGRPVQGPTPLKEKDNLILGRTTVNFFRLDLNPPAPPAPFEHPLANTRFAEGTREKAVLDALAALSEQEGPAAPAAPKMPSPPAGMPKPPLPPTPRKP